MATDVFAGVRLERSPVYGTKGMVVSGHSLASTAGLRTLDRGGSLIDAMISTSATLSVVLQHATSLGGDAFFLYHDAAQKKTIGLNATGHAPDGATPEYFKDGILTEAPEQSRYLEWCAVGNGFTNVMVSCHGKNYSKTLSMPQKDILHRAC